MKQGLWLSRDDYGNYWLQFDCNIHSGDMFIDAKDIEPIFVKLDGGELEKGKCIRVNLVEDDLKYEEG